MVSPLEMSAEVLDLVCASFSIQSGFGMPLFHDEAGLRDRFRRAFAARLASHPVFLNSSSAHVKAMLI